MPKPLMCPPEVLNQSPNPNAHDDDMAQRLYEHSRQLVGLEAS